MTKSSERPSLSILTAAAEIAGTLETPERTKQPAAAAGASS
jgi:hypothetical protein